MSPVAVARAWARLCIAPRRKSSALLPMAGPLRIPREFSAVSVLFLRSDSPPSTGRPAPFAVPPGPAGFLFWARAKRPPEGVPDMKLASRSHVLTLTGIGLLTVLAALVILVLPALVQADDPPSDPPARPTGLTGSVSPTELASVGTTRATTPSPATRCSGATGRWTTRGSFTSK